MTYAEIIKNDNGTKTAIYGFKLTTGTVYDVKSYTVKITNVTKDRIYVRYHYQDGQEWEHSFRPNAFFETFIKHNIPTLEAD